MDLNASYMHLIIPVRLRILDHGDAEPEFDEPTRPAQAEEAANTKLTECKPWCIPPIIFSFCFNHYFMLSMLVH
jgi:hypothetical protein